ncbi:MULTISPECIES: hypothetical protein [Arthrobacter]|uniref:Uncharacterized protein n=2 Tax=Arthrobacter TaxID=1663 RepID=A0ABU9KLT7_9MICC|nr:hypothetical protein [Arthrobacter sp. YJM1]MDP5227536.1 hypothetical protein [Arthrobacter sp. YJM1]
MSSQYPGASSAASGNEPPAGLGYAAPARNTFGFDLSNLKKRLLDVTGVPQQLTYSYWLWAGGAVLGIIFSILNIFIATAALGAYTGIMAGAAIGSLIWGIIWGAAVIFVAIRLKEGSRWARIVLTVLGALAVIAFFVELATLNLTAVSSAATVAGAVLMWMPQSQKHFA